MAIQMGNTTEQGRDEQQRPRIFNPSEHLTQLKSRDGSKDYLPVCWRLVWFREKFPHGSIETELVHLDLDRETEEEVFVWNQEKRRSEKVVKHAKGMAIFRATIRDGEGGVATGTKMEKAASFGDWLEKAETGAIGRALAELGYGTQFTSEFDEAHRIVDSPLPASEAVPDKPHQDRQSEAQPEQADTARDSRKERLTTLYRTFYKLNLFEKGASEAESQKNYLVAVSEILHVNITATGQLTTSRIEVLEKYAESKDAA